MMIFERLFRSVMSYVVYLEHRIKLNIWGRFFKIRSNASVNIPKQIAYIFGNNFSEVMSESILVLFFEI